jgi:ATP-dependent exoDNAse (exonuclease V) alpha subunit
LLYTAVTRAKKKLTIITENSADKKHIIKEKITLAMDV